MIVESRVLRSWLWNGVAAAAVCVPAAGFVVAGMLSVRTPGGETGLAIVLVLVAALAIRLLRLGVYATPEGLVVRELLRTHRLSWESLRCAAVEDNRGRYSARGPVLYNPCPYYERDARVRLVTVTALGAYREAIAQRRVDDLNVLIHAQTGRMTTPSPDRPPPHRQYPRAS